MITRVLVPDVGATGGAMRLAEWLVKEDDRVAAGQPLFALETDKATQEIEAFCTGYLRRILADRGATVEQGTVIALLTDTPDEPLETTGEPPINPATAPSPSPGPSDSAGVPGADSSKPQRKGTGRVLASPLARRLAREQGIDLAALTGSGPQGQIHKRDILKAAAAIGRFAATHTRARRVPLSPMRRAVAQRTQVSKTTIPHFYAASTVDMTDVLAVRQQLERHAVGSGLTPPTVNDLVLRAAALALRQTPQLNACLDGSDLVYLEDIDVGLAVGVEDGVLVPVLRRADLGPLWELARTAKLLRERAAAGALAAEEMAGGALTVSNLGMYGLDSFTAVINPPQAAVLAVGAARQQPAVHNGQLAVCTLMQVTLSIDHRVADGVVAARFLGAFRRLLEAPAEFLSDERRESHV
jgi:pyruvate dehydrogenase E2 component (dihydrolipoamide acetyltransferase)